MENSGLDFHPSQDRQELKLFNHRNDSRRAKGKEGRMCSRRNINVQLNKLDVAGRKPQ